MDKEIFKVSPEEEEEALQKLLNSIEAKSKEIEEREEKAREVLVKEGFPLEGGTTYPPKDYPRDRPVGLRLKREVLDSLRRKGYNFVGENEAWEDPSTGIILYFNWAPLWRVHDESDFESEGWGRIFIDAFGRSQEVGEAQARLEAGRIARVVKNVPGIKDRHFVGTVVCEGL